MSITEYVKFLYLNSSKGFNNLWYNVLNFLICILFKCKIIIFSKLFFTCLTLRFNRKKNIGIAKSLGRFNFTC